MRDLKKMVRRITAVFFAGVIAAGIVCTPALAATRPSSQEETEEARELSRREIRQLNEDFNMDDVGFYVCTYARPEEIDWNQVVYNGAGMGLDLEDEPALKEFLEQYYAGEMEMTGVTIIREKDFQRLVKEKSATDYADARNKLIWNYYDEGELYFNFHGDTNAIPISFTDGTVTKEEDGSEIYRLHYEGSDARNYRFSREFEITFREKNGKRNYISNLPADAPAPVELVTIEYFEREQQVKRAGAEELIDSAYDEDTEFPDSWYWALITASEDGVRYVIDEISEGLAEKGLPTYLFGSDGTFIPGNNVTSGVLDKGESIAVYVDLSWQPHLKLKVTKDNYYGAVVFGEQNWTNLRDEPEEFPRADYVMGHDLEGEHRGVTWEEETDLVNFLSGSWVWYDPVIGGPGALVTFDDYRKMTVMPLTAGGGYFELFLDYDHIYTDKYDAPDLICTKPYNEDTEKQMKERTLDRLFGGGGTGDYLVSAIQLDGEQILTLDQANNGEGILGYIFPGAGEFDHSFELYRYVGVAQEENQGAEPGGARTDQDQTVYDPNRGIDIPWERIMDSFEAMQDWDEVAEKVDLGMDVYFDSVQEIKGKYCYVFDFGTDHPENYVHEDFYAISEDLRTVYRQDYLSGDWKIVK